ncbi:CHASE2 domain-containing protein [Brunnivagina elsteri]|uniref:non-specific serine/threonine protein kinase n=1 Tax=Brunnivagina elsteri CCALA 953 TaxID=987040 RepID=A0A2A2TKR6_9CYAN|nr:CHASE2 domain-containing serine/threonine-protein kinase [Calothrix elsteri]PAX57177.1 serine/threonine protein kinase [Calothrix elsteri CCALA 953]
MIRLFKKMRFLNTKLDVKDNHGEISVADRQANDLSVQDVQDNQPKGKLSLLLVASVSVTALITGMRHLQWLESSELAAYDYMVRSRTATTPDNRLLVVKVTEDDIQREGYPLHDATVNKLLAKLESYQPRVIGLNIYRPQQTNFGDGVKNKSDIIGVCKFSSLKDPEIPPPSNFIIDNIGFNDLAPDSDRTIRRALLFADSSDKKCNTSYSFASLLALAYLQKQNIEQDFLPNKDWVLGKTVIPPLRKTDGSYEKMDDGGYQIMLDYRHPDSLVKEVTITDVLNNKVNPNLIKDKLVIIGNTANSTDRGVPTPYSALSNQPFGTPPVFIHAQTVSQILSIVLDGKRQIWYLQDWQEIGWIWLWAVFGGVLALRTRNPMMLLVVGATSIGGLLGICYLLFLQAAWIPIVPPAMALLMTGVSVMAYSTYRTQIETRIIILQVEKQQEAIAQLSALLKENTRISDTSLPSNVIVDTPQRNTGDFLLSGRYEISRVLGSGGFGCTYLAKDTQRPGNPTCVVKQLMPARRDARFMEVARRLFDAEAEILLILGKHIQIPDLLAFFEENQEFYLVQEYVKGKTLNQELSSVKNAKDEAYVIEMLKSVLYVLKFVHEHRVIHRDIKPENIIRNSQDNKLVLIDFGAVKKMQPANTEKTELATVAIGTRGYAAPEQLVGHPRLSSDIFALGMIAIQALTGIQPHALEINPDTGSVEWRNLAQVSDKLAAIIDKMVCYHFSDRYQSAAEVLEELKRID